MKEYDRFAIDIAKEAGKIIKENFSLGMKKEWKEDHTPVTEVDINVNKLLIGKVKEFYPDHSVLGEEESVMVDNSEFTWVCDPVDGTIPFSHGVPIFTFSLALCREGEPIVGVVYDPIMDRMFSASKGKGAYLNGENIGVSKLTDLSKSIMNIDGGGVKIGVNQEKVMTGLKSEKTKVFKLLSVIYGGVMTASGEFVGTVFLKDTCHDAAAMKIIIEEAGGKVTDIDGNNQRYDKPINGFVGTNGVVHERFLEIIKKFRQ